MGFARTADKSGMDSVSAIRSTRGPLDTYVQALREAKAFQMPAAPPSTSSSNSADAGASLGGALLGADPLASFDALNKRDPKAAQQLMLHFISHVDAECFISLLKILDPPPDDERKKAEYRRYYHQLREVLTIPPPPPDPQPIWAPLDPLR
jgi:hypothetical protein